MYWLVTVTHYAYTHSRHDALPFSLALRGLPLRRRSPTLDPAFGPHDRRDVGRVPDLPDAPGTGLLGDVHRGTLQALWCGEDRKSTRLNSSHVKTSYAFFCLQKITL